MFVPHALIGTIFGFVTAVWACGEGYSLLTMLGFYMLAGSLAAATSAGASLAWPPQQEHPDDVQDG
jgi:hypothetical protein